MRALPSGTVTFLFTDIEGSTRLWEERPQAMWGALARHDAILGMAIQAHGGHAFKTVGDAFYAAFALPTDALEAALAMQRTLRDEAWPETGPLRVRAALHTGAAEHRDNDYFGQPLNRVARLLAAGHGGQVLLSLSTAELVRDALPPGTLLRDLGERRLKDLQRPERVFQLIAPPLPADFPPLRTLDSRINNLPTQATPLLGREEEARSAGDLLARPDVRLVTLTGPGGTGKTRLGLQVAADVLHDFADGVFFVALAAVRETALALPTTAKVLGVREVAGRPIFETLSEHLRTRQLLLVLDNFEQVVEAALEVSELIAACPRLKVLVSSRVPLRVYGERELAVPPLPLPDPRHASSAERLSQYAAVRLFVERAQAVKADFALDDANAPAVAEICARLDGLPLAIELAAARIRLLTPQAMIARLEHRLAFLTGGARDLPARQQTLRGAMAWSYELLEEGERRLFWQLGVFAGGWTIEAAEAIAGEEVEVLGGLESLVAKSLARQDADMEGEPRFQMLETIREYALEQLGQSGEADEVRRRHATYFLALAEQAEPELRGAQQAAWLDRCDREHDNLRAALRWSLESGHAELGLRLGGALRLWWFTRGYLSEGRRRLTELLAVPAAAATPARAKALHTLGMLESAQGDRDAAPRHYEESLAIRREQGDRFGSAVVLENLGELHEGKGDLAAARPLYEQSLALVREVGDGLGIAWVLCSLGRVASLQRDWTAARSLLDEAHARLRAANDPRGVMSVLHALANVAHEQATYAEARTLLGQALAIAQELGSPTGVSDTLEGFAAVAVAEGRLERAVRLSAAGAALRDAIQAQPSPAERDRAERRLEPARRALDESTATRAWAEGTAMGLDQAVAYALRDEN